MRRSALVPLLLAVALGSAACSPGGEDPVDASGGSSVTATSGASGADPSPSGSSSAVPAELPVLSWRGLGDVRFGMTPDEAASALGVKLVRTSGYMASRAELGCGYLEPGPASGLPSGLDFMVTGPGEGVINRVDVSEGPYRTDGGIRIGDDRAAVLALQPEGIDVDSSEVAVGVEVITLNPLDDAATAVEVFTLPDGTVTSFHAGEREEASFSEGCS